MQSHPDKTEGSSLTRTAVSKAPARELAEFRLTTFEEELQQLGPIAFGGKISLDYVEAALTAAEHAGADVTDLREHYTAVLRKFGHVLQAGAVLSGNSLTAAESSGEVSLDASLVLSRLSDSGGFTELSNPSSLLPGVYEIEGGKRWIVKREGKSSIQSFGPPHYDLPYLLRGNRHLTFRGSLSISHFEAFQENQLTYRGSLA